MATKPMSAEATSSQSWEYYFASEWSNVERLVHANARANGFWDNERNDGEAIALIHSEASEALEALRKGNPPDDKTPEFSGAEAELADVVIRIMDLAAGKKWDIAGAIVAKIRNNATRERLHGKEF